jgi:hypothetical protein
LIVRVGSGWVAAAAKDEHIRCPTQMWGQNTLTKNFDTDAAAAISSPALPVVLIQT